MEGVICLKDFSTYRSVLMGLAIIFIMASHTLGGYAAFGIIGVEWFLVLSSIGQYFSLKKKGEIKGYYKRRLIRLLPAYLIIAVPFFFILNPYSIKDYLIRLSGLNLALWGERFFWFVTLIFLCYLIAPFYFKLIESYKISFVFPFILTGIMFLLSFYSPKTEILFTRIPVFLLGMNLAKFVYEGIEIKDRARVIKCGFISVFSVLFLLTIYIDWLGIEFVRLIYFLCAIPSLYFSLVIAKSLGFLQAPLAWVGAISYELYLVHQHIALAICSKLAFPRAIIVICSYVVGVALAYLLHLVVIKLVHIFIGK